MAARSSISLITGRLKGIRSLRAAIFPVRLQPLPVTAPAVTPPRRRGPSHSSGCGR